MGRNYYIVPGHLVDWIRQTQYNWYDMRSKLGIVHIGKLYYSYDTGMSFIWNIEPVSWKTIMGHNVIWDEEGTKISVLEFEDIINCFHNLDYVKRNIEWN